MARAFNMERFYSRSPDEIIGGYRAFVEDFRSTFTSITKTILPEEQQDLTAKTFECKAQKIDEKLDHILPFQNNEYSTESFLFAGLLELYFHCLDEACEPLKGHLPNIHSAICALGEKIMAQFDHFAFKIASLNNLFHQIVTEDHTFKADTVSRTNELVANMEKLVKENERLNAALEEQSKKNMMQKAELLDAVIRLEKENLAYSHTLEQFYGENIDGDKKKLAKNSGRQVENKGSLSSLHRHVSNPDIKVLAHGTDQYTSNFNSNALSKSMTAKQCGQIAIDILREKILHNEQSLENGDNFDSLRSFVATYINRKYSNGKQAEEIEKNFIEGIKIHDKSDINVRLFTQIIDDKIDENFFLIYEEARSSLSDALYVV